MGRHQTGYIFQSASEAFHVRYYTTEIGDGQPKRVQKSHSRRSLTALQVGESSRRS
jgi:hypothetical protein